MSIDKRSVNSKAGAIQAKEPPNNIEAERAVLGACLRYPEQNISLVLQTLSSDDFHAISHKRLFEMVGKLFLENAPIDLVTLTNHLRKEGKLQEVGGATYLADLMESCHTDANVKYHCGIVKEKSNKRRLGRIGLALYDRAYADDGTTPQELVSLTGEHLFAVTRGDAESGHRRAGRLDFENYIGRELGIGGLSWGIEKLDEMTGGMAGGDLAILAGLEKQGKTALAMHIARHNAKHGKKILFFSLEMSASALTQRIIASEARVPSLHLKTGRLTLEELQAVNTYLESETKKLIWENFLVDDRPQTKQTLPAVIRLYTREYPISLLVLDYVTLFCAMEPKEVAETMRLFKAIAKEYNVPFLALAQRNRPPKNEEAKPPQANDLLIGGERDADFLLFVWNPISHLLDQPINTLNYQQQRDVADWEKKVRVFLKYDRAGGGKGAVDLFFDRNCGFFGEFEGKRVGDYPE